MMYSATVYTSDGVGMRALLAHGTSARAVRRGVLDQMRRRAPEVAWLISIEVWSGPEFDTPGAYFTNELTAHASR